MMRFHQIRELVLWATDFHAQLASHYTQQAAGEVGERVRMALDYVAEHETGMQKDLERYLAEDSEHSSVLDTWFDEPEDIPHASVLEGLSPGGSNDSVQSVLATALATHRTLQDLYAHRASRAASKAESDFFNALTSGHEGEVRRLSRDMQRLEDY